MKGHSIDWRLVFELNVASTMILYWPELPKFFLILFSQLLFGVILWSIGHSYARKSTNSRYIRTLYCRYSIVAIVVGFCVVYSSISYFHPSMRSWEELSSNVVLNLLPATFKYYIKTENKLQLYWNQCEIDPVEQLIRAPAVRISQPSTILRKPIKHVFLIISESIRADVLPLNVKFAEAVGTRFHTNTTRDSVTPFLNYLWNNSVRTTATTVASYTLKSLIGTICGIYPLNIDFLEEINQKNKFYEICLPDLLHKTFRRSKNQSMFRSAFLTAARDNFDHQRELIKRMGFNEIYSGFEIAAQNRSIPDVGMFGPPDAAIMPLLWHWFDSNLNNDKERKLLTTLLMTGTHDPFVMPPTEAIYHNYIEDTRANKYLNTIRVADFFLKTIVDGLKLRRLYDETLIVILSDHGYAFRDWGKESLALWRVSFEAGFSIPLMLHNPHLKPKHLNGQFTNMDVLPTIMDTLLSSQKVSDDSDNSLLTVQQDQLESILARYEGTSLLRLPVEQQLQRYTFHLDNPGDSYIIVKQHPRKLVYDSHYDDVHLFHLEYDPHESIDLILFDRSDYVGDYPDWLLVDHSQNSSPSWSGRWVSTKNNLSDNHKKILFKRINQSTSGSRSNVSRISLQEMLDWADAALQLASIWTALVKARYFYGNMTFSP